MANMAVGDLAFVQIQKLRRRTLPDGEGYVNELEYLYAPVKVSRIAGDGRMRKGVRFDGKEVSTRGTGPKQVYIKADVLTRSVDEVVTAIALTAYHNLEAAAAAVAPYKREVKTDAA